MAEPTEESGLHEYIDTELVIEDLKTPTQEKALYDTLEKLKGVHNVTIKNEKVSVRYEPVRVTEEAIVAAIEGAGFRIADQHSAPASPMTDALVSGVRSSKK
jgi:copper chaperone CopZ